jgi:hypothetical protein
LFLNVLGGTRRLIDGPALFRSLSIADLLEGLVALLDGLFDSLLFEGNLASFLKVLLADLLLGGGELCHIGVVALFDIFVGTLQNGVLLKGLDSLLLLNAAQTGFGVINAT